MKSSNPMLAPATSRLLSPVTLRSVMEPKVGDSSVAVVAVKRLVELGMSDGVGTIRALMWRCHRWLNRHHRNEQIYRRAAMEQLVPANKTVRLFQEFRMGQSIVDYLFVSGALHAVEIKSDVDGLGRLTSQLNDYRRIAPCVSVLGAQHLVERVAELQQFTEVGLLWLDDTGRIRVLRDAVHAAQHLEPMAMMCSLRRSEFVQVSERMGAPVPAMPNTKVFRYVQGLTKNFDPIEYHHEVVRVLGLRPQRLSPWAVSRVPSPLKPAVLKLNPTRDGLARLHFWLNQEVASVFA